MHWSGNANPPRAGGVNDGRPGAQDPGGYLRGTHQPSQVIRDRNDVSDQIDRLPNHGRIEQENRRFFNEDPTGWPGRWRPRPDWGVRFGFCDHLWFDTLVAAEFFCWFEFCPTDYIFIVGTGQFWAPGEGWGYVDFLPDGYFEPITIAVEEVVPVYDDDGNIVAYEEKTFYYNAVWDPDAEAYGYFDYQGEFHWLSFPWLNSW